MRNGPHLRAIQGGKKDVAKKPRRKRPAARNPDPNAKNGNRVFEITTTKDESTDAGSYSLRIRIRFEKGAFDDNVFEFAQNRWFVGLISELHGSRWTPYGWGCVSPADCAIIREIFPELDKPKEPAK